MSQQINLFNPDFLKKRELFTAIMLLQVLAVLLVVMVGATIQQYRQVQIMTMQAKEGAVQLEQERARLVEVAAEYAPRPRDSALDKKTANLEALLLGKDAVLEVLRSDSLGNTKGYSGYMQAFARQAVNGLWLTSFSITGTGQDMAMGGRTLRSELLPAYILRLNQEVVTQGREFSALEIRQPKEEPATPDKPAGKANYLEFNLYSKAAEGAR